MIRCANCCLGGTNLLLLVSTWEGSWGTLETQKSQSHMTSLILPECHG